jgi:MFS family permease
VLQSGVNIGILGAVLANYLMADLPPRYVFLVGVLPALLVFWIRRAVPEPEEWHAAKASAVNQLKIIDLFRGDTRPITLWVTVVCAISLTAHWAFMFWHQQHLRNLPDVLAMSSEERNKLASSAMYLIIGSSILGNFFSGWIARFIGYRATIGWTFIAYFAFMFGAYIQPRDHTALLRWFPLIGFCQGAFALFTMYLPPLFPTLLRTTGSGFSYNIGRTAAAAGTVFFGLFSKVGDHRLALLYAGFLFVPAAFLSFLMPKAKD